MTDEKKTTTKSARMSTFQAEEMYKYSKSQNIAVGMRSRSQGRLKHVPEGQGLLKDFYRNQYCADIHY